MAKCKFCGEDMLDSLIGSCHANRILEFEDGVIALPIPYTRDYGGPEQRCHDCNIAFGGFHHPSCDMERCPRCGGQLISCGCKLKEITNE